MSEEAIDDRTVVYSTAEQQTDQWFEERLGKYTSSRIHRVMQNPKNKGYQTMAAEIAVERIAGERKMFTSKITNHGIEHEEHAADMLALQLPEDLTHAGFAYQPGTLFGASCDYLVGDNGVAEIKCPVDPGKHMSRLINDFESEVINQVNWQLGITERRNAWICSYLRQLPLAKRLFVQRYTFDWKLFDKQVKACDAMEAIVQQMVEKVG